MGSRSNNWNWAGQDERGNNLDTYLSTDDEGDGSPLHRNKARNMAEEAAHQQAELARAKRMAHRQIEYQKDMEIERAFAVLDNVREGETRLQRQKNKPAKSKSQLKPSDNCFIDDEAAEAGESDSDMGDEESFNSENLFTQSDISTSVEEEQMPEIFSGSSHVPTLNCQSEACGQGNHPTMYEDYSASRELTEAQIQQEQKEKMRHEFCNSSSDDCCSASIDDSDDASETDTELEASFSSVVG